MRYDEPEIKALSSLHDLLSAVVEGFPDQAFDQYTKKQKQRMISCLISFSDENNLVLSAETAEIVYPHPKLKFDKLRATLQFAHEKYRTLTTARHNDWVAFAKLFDPLIEAALIRMIEQRLFADMFLFV